MECRIASTLRSKFLKLLTLNNSADRLLWQFTSQIALQIIFCLCEDHGGVVVCLLYVVAENRCTKTKNLDIPKKHKLYKTLI